MSGLVVCPSLPWCTSVCSHAQGTQANDVQTPWGQKIVVGLKERRCVGALMFSPSSEYLGGSGDAMWLKRVVLFSKPCDPEFLGRWTSLRIQLLSSFTRI